MSVLSAPLVLASASPRRRSILETLGLSFRVARSDVDESRLSGESPEQYVLRVAEAKATVVASGLASETPEPFVLGADTAVVLGDDVLGKPRDDAEGRDAILRLAGRAHRVMTGVAVVRPHEGVLESVLVTATVRFRKIDPPTASRYVATGEGRDKAGGYAAQGLGAGLISSIEGSYFTVVGLPAAETLALLGRVGLLAEWP